MRDRGEGQAEAAALPQTGPSGSGPHKLDKHEREGLGQWLCEFGRERTMPARESNPEERVYMVGVEETRRWHGRFGSMPLPAYCTLCSVRLPYSNQAVTHFEGGDTEPNALRRVTRLWPKPSRASSPLLLKVT